MSPEKISEQLRGTFGDEDLARPQVSERVVAHAIEQG